jgi:hypothetical protein
MQVPQAARDVDIPSRACIDFVQRQIRRVQTHASPREIKCFSVRSDPEWNPNSISRTSHDIDRRPSKGITF